ncbi:MAG: hypothetical protein G01um101438_543 [Parcubacteria group bacterium Gr01-1014_38]|nr:MAG: hypothetical protein G01um101438_543 [Parcubacteria group bacterium Gr01-1014_38]
MRFPKCAAGKYHLQFEFFRKRHAGLCGTNDIQQFPTKHPHTGLRVLHARPKKNARSAGQKMIPESADPWHCLSLQGKPGTGKTIKISIEKLVHKARRVFYRILSITIHGDKNVRSRSTESCLIRAPIPRLFLKHDMRSMRSRNFRGLICRIVVDNNHFIHRRRHPRKETFQPPLFVVAGDDNADRVPADHGGTLSYFPNSQKQKFTSRRARGQGKRVPRAQEDE